MIFNKIVRDMSRLQSRLAPKVAVPNSIPVQSNNNATVEKVQRMELRRPNLEVKGPCMCSRPKQIVLCQKCGANFSGRVAGGCSHHPGRIYLLDFSCCPQCKAGPENLLEYPESGPRQVQSSIKRRKYDNTETMDLEDTTQ